MSAFLIFFAREIGTDICDLGEDAAFLRRAKISQPPRNPTWRAAYRARGPILRADTTCGAATALCTFAARNKIRASKRRL
jgi:hypothetical protein